MGRLDAAGGLELAGLSFVGTTNAAAAPLARMAGELSRRAAEPLAINSSGLLRGPGIALKLAKIRQVAPDLIVAIGAAADLAPILDRSGVSAIRLNPAPAARRKSAGQRAASRRAAFAMHLARAERVILPIAGERPALCLTDPAARPVCAVFDSKWEDLALGIFEEGSDGGVALIVPPVAHPIAGIRLGAMWARKSETGWRLLDTLLPAHLPVR